MYQALAVEVELSHGAGYPITVWVPEGLMVVEDDPEDSERKLISVPSNTEIYQTVYRAIRLGDLPGDRAIVGWEGDPIRMMPPEDWTPFEKGGARAIPAS